MPVSRRDFLAKGAGMAAAATAGALAAGCEKATTASKPAVKVAACGLACDVCPLMKAGKCKGCGPAKDVAAAMVEKKNCPVLTCANKKGIEYCGTDCAKFTQCAKMIDRPYSEACMARIAKKLG